MKVFGWRFPMKNSNLGRGLSFGYTTPELLSGFKTITRRCWKEKYANYFLRTWNQKLFPALNKGYYAGGKAVGLLQILEIPYQQVLFEMPESDLSLEGFPQLSKSEFIDRFFGGDSSMVVWVLRFNFTPMKQK